jgi:hypothetical protein
MADQVDISGMPAPPQGYAEQQSDPTDGMPSPEDQYRQFYFGGGEKNAATGKYGPTDPIPKDVLDDFTANPPSSSVAENLKHGASALTGLPRVAATAALAVPAAVAGGAGALSGAAGAAADPENAGEYLDKGRQRLRDWSSGVYKLADYLPATQRGAEAANTLNSLPGEIGKSVNDTMVRPVVGDNAADTLADIGQDVGTVLPAAGAGAYARGAARGVGKVAGAAKDFVKSEAASVNAPNADAPAPDMTPPVGAPVSPESLRAAPNPIPPPDGTVAAERQKAAQPAPAPAEPSAPPAKPSEPTLPATDDAPQDMSLSQEQRAIVREGVAARRRASDNAPDTTQSPGDAQRGSVRLFNSPKDEGPQETPRPEQQDERAAHLDAIDQLSGGKLPTRRTSALTGDYNATGDDYQAKEVGSAPMRQQIASENNALHAAANNVHDSAGSDFENSVDSQTLGDRGRVTRNAIQAIEKHFNDATDSVYDTARAANSGRPIPKLQRVSDYLNDDSNFTNDAEIGLQRAAKQRMDRLWSTGDPDKGTPPGSVNAAERLREFLNEKGKNPSAMGVAKDLKSHLDMDVAEHGGPGLFQTARNMRRHQFQMLEEPTGIKKLLAPGDSQGINHAIPEHKVMDYIADLPREQHEHVMNVLRAGAHLDPEIAKTSAAAIREIQAHAISRIHDAATNSDGTWNARKFYSAADRYANNAQDTFKDRPDILKNLKTINDAGNTLSMDKHYPGAVAQGERTSAMGQAVGAVGHVASNLAQEVPFGGRIVGRAIERATDKVTGQVNEASRDKAVAQRLVDRNGKQRGAVGDLSQRDAIQHETSELPGYRASKNTSSSDVVHHRYKVPGDELGPGGQMHVTEFPERGVSQVSTSRIVPSNRGQGWGTRMLQRAADDAHARGQVLRSDAQVSDGAAGAYSNLKKLGYDVQMKDNDHTGGAYHSVGDHVFEVRPGAKGKAPSNQRGSVQLFNDNRLSRSAEDSDNQRRGVGINPRNERNERVANQQMGGRKPLTDEQNDILGRLSGGKQRGSVKVMGDEKHPEVLEDSRAIADHIRSTSPSFVDHERIEDEFKGAHAVLRQIPVDSLKEGDANGNVADARKQARYSKNPQNAPPIVTENGTVVDGNHRLRAARAAGLKTIAAYDVREGEPLTKAGQRGSVEEPPRSEEDGSTLNIGLHQGQPGEKGFRKMSKQEAQSAVESTGAKVTKTSVLTPKQHGVMEPTAVMSTDRPLSHDEMQQVLAKTKQSAIPQRTETGEESMHIQPGHEETAEKEGWNKFNPDYFREHSGRTMADTEKSKRPDWFEKGAPVSRAELNNHPDARDILEPEEFGHDWRHSDVPVSKVFSDNAPYSDPNRMASIRSAKSVPPILGSLTEDGRVKILDGGHRLAVAKERGDITIPALVSGGEKVVGEYPPHPDATVRNAKRSAYPGIYDDPMDVVTRAETVPESPHLKEIFGTTRKEMHDAVIKQGDVAPKTPMPGMAEKGKGSAHAQQVTTPENAKRLRDTISALKEAAPDAYHGMVSWYHMDPMFKSIKKILGGDADRAGDVFHKLNTYTALASPMSSVNPEIVRGTAAATAAAEGKFDQFKKYGGLPAEKVPKSATALKDQEMGFEGHAFHGTAHAPAMSRFNETGQEANAPKTGAYRRASDAPSRPGSEYQNTVLVGDSHFSRGAGLADVRGAKAYDGSIDGTELKTIHPWYHENVAKPLGIPATSAQAAQWAALSHETGVNSPIGSPKLEIWADQIASAAKRAGVEPKEMWERIVKRLAK